MIIQKQNRPRRALLVSDSQGRRALAPGVVYVELVNLLGSIWWAYLFSLPGSLFSTNPAFNGLSHHAPEWQWGLVFVAAITGLSLGLCRPYPLLRFLALAWACGVWGGVATCFAISAPILRYTPVNTGVGIYGAVSFVSFLAMMHLSPMALLDSITLLQVWQAFFRKRKQDRANG